MMIETLLSEIMSDTHRYVRGVAQHRPTNVRGPAPPWRRAVELGLQRCRDLAERAAVRAGFTRRHFDPGLAAERLERILTLSQGLQHTYELLADDRSRRAFLDLLKLRVLGPYHAALRLTPEAFRERQAYAEQALRLQRDTFTVSDPWFGPLSLYRIPGDDHASITLHSHSVDVASVFLLGQYSYCSGSLRLGAGPGDVVLDVGGCWGDTALQFANRVGPLGRVYTFEFDPESLEVMRANLQLNPHLAARIEVVKRALWSRSGALLEFAQAGRMTRLLEAGAKAAAPTIQTLTVDDFAEQAGVDRVGFIKIDVEGAELDVLRGAERSLRRFAPRLAIAAYHRDDDLVEIPQWIESLQLGYRFYLDTFSPVEDETVLFAAVDETR